MEEQVKKAPVKKVASKNTEIVLGSAAVKIAAGVKSLVEAVTLVNGLEQKAQDQTLIVVNLEDKIGGLEQDLKNKTAQNKIEIEQAYTADQKSFVDKWCKDNNMTAVETTTWNRMESDLVIATQKVNETVEAAVKATTVSLSASHNNALKIKDLEHEKKEANNTAELAQSKSQITFLEGQITSMRKMIEDMQKNETERAKYGQIGTLNVGQPQR